MKRIDAALLACLTLAVPGLAATPMGAEFGGGGAEKAVPAETPVLPASQVPARATEGLVLPQAVPVVEAAPVGAAAEVSAAAAQVEKIEAQGAVGSAEATAIANVVTGGKDAVQGEASAVAPVLTEEEVEASLASQVEERSAFVARYREEFGKAIVGQPEMRDSLLISLLTGGNVLLEGVPGVAKTRAVKALGKIVDLQSGRIQFTRDLMPADIVGQEEKNRKTEEWEIRKGPVFVNVLLADEINRAKGMTQSGLLQAMEEHQVTVGGQDLALPDPFVVLATQNPIEEEGVHPLPKAQLDRFMFKLNVGKPSGEELRQIIEMNLASRDITVQKVISRDELLAARDTVRRVIVSKDVQSYISRIVDETDPSLTHVQAVKDSVNYGAAPRAGNWLAIAAQAHAFMEGRYYVMPEDVMAVAPRVLRHRLILKFEADGRVSPDSIVAAILKSVPPVTVKMKLDPAKKRGFAAKLLGSK